MLRRFVLIFALFGCLPQGSEDPPFEGGGAGSPAPRLDDRPPKAQKAVVPAICTIGLRPIAFDCLILNFASN